MHCPLCHCLMKTWQISSPPCFEDSLRVVMRLRHLHCFVRFCDRSSFEELRTLFFLKNQCGAWLLILYILAAMLHPWLRSYMLRYPEPWVASVTSYSNFDFYILNFIGKYYQGSFYSYSCVIEVEYKYCNRYVNQKSFTWTPPLVVPTNFSGRDFDSIFSF